MADVERRVPKRRLLPANPFQARPDRAHELKIARPPDATLDEMENEMCGELRFGIAYRLRS